MAGNVWILICVCTCIHHIFIIWTQISIMYMWIRHIFICTMSSYTHVYSISGLITREACCSVLQCVAVCCSVLQCAGVCCSMCLNRRFCQQTTEATTEWRIPIGYCMFIGHFPQESPIRIGSCAERDLELKSPYASLPPCEKWHSALWWELFLFLRTVTSPEKTCSFWRVVKSAKENCSFFHSPVAVPVAVFYSQP